MALALDKSGKLTTSFLNDCIELEKTMQVMNGQHRIESLKFKRRCELAKLKQRISKCPNPQLRKMLYQEYKQLKIQVI